MFYFRKNLSWILKTTFKFVDLKYPWEPNKMREFCDTPLWDSNLTWYTENPKGNNKNNLEMQKNNISWIFYFKISNYVNKTLSILFDVYCFAVQFTSCFEETVLVYIPVFILLLFIPAEIQGFRNSSARNIPWGPRYMISLLLLLLLLSLLLLLLLWLSLLSLKVFFFQKYSLFIQNAK